MADYIMGVLANEDDEESLDVTATWPNQGPHPLWGPTPYMSDDESLDVEL